MNLRIRNSDPRMIEDEFGNEMFKFVGLHLGDVQDFVNRINSYTDLEREVKELEDHVDYLQDELGELRDSISENID